MTEKEERLLKAAEILKSILPEDYDARVNWQVVDMPIDPDHIEIFKKGLVRRTVARLYQDDESDLFELNFEDPIESIINAVTSL